MVAVLTLNLYTYLFPGLRLMLRLMSKLCVSGRVVLSGTVYANDLQRINYIESCLITLISISIPFFRIIIYEDYTTMKNVTENILWS